MVRTKKYYWLAVSLLAGVVFSLLLHYLGEFLYDDTYHHWYRYIGRTYHLPQDISQSDKLTYFIIFAFIGLIFSPIGEELFFRGIVHSSLASSVGEYQCFYD